MHFCVAPRVAVQACATRLLLFRYQQTFQITIARQNRKEDGFIVFDSVNDYVSANGKTPETCPQIVTAAAEIGIAG